MVTSNLEYFGGQELHEASRILCEMARTGTPSNFYNSGLTLNFNTLSGFVFLSNEEYDACLLNDDGNLEMWYNLPYKGNEGFILDLYNMFMDGCIEHKEDVEQLAEYLESEGYREHAYEVRTKFIENSEDDNNE